ncbi:MAG: adenylate/guanylate cyclase domain-containing protein [Burkholderiales bacterium]|nr:adenylate/guanylate cyclase domain-containing protein [Burkholderiales bacterium]
MDTTGPAALFQRELAASVEATLVQQARRNEVTVARVRAIALGFVTVLDVVLWTQPPGFTLPYAFSGLNPLLAAAWLAAALALAAALSRGWYRPWLRAALPLVDGAIMLSLFACIVLTAQSIEYVRPAVTNTAIACALLAVSGALRLKRRAVWITTAMSVVVFATVASLAGNPVPETLFACALLVGVGFLGMWMNEIARRSVRSEVGRLVLGRFLPREVVDGAHTEPLALLARPRRLVATVLVSDLRGFTSQAEHMPPEQVLQLLNQVQSTLAGIVHRHHGRVDKFMGDGLLAVFGMEPGGDADHAAQAVQAAREMGAAIAPPLKLGIGVHSGPLVAGCLGSGLRLEFTVIGDTVNTAARLQDMTKEFGVDLLVSAETRRLAGGGGEWRSLGAVAIRGRQGEQELFTPAVGSV